MPIRLPLADETLYGPPNQVVGHMRASESRATAHDLTRPPSPSEYLQPITDFAQKLLSDARSDVGK